MQRNWLRYLHIAAKSWTAWNNVKHHTSYIIHLLSHHTSSIKHQTSSDCTGGRMAMQFDTASQNKIIQGNKTMRSITFYDKNGDPFCYTEDDCHIYDFDGNPIAYIESESVWNYDGKHLGFMHNGWPIDHSGDCLLDPERSRGCPLKPLRSFTPLKGL